MTVPAVVKTRIGRNRDERKEENSIKGERVKLTEGRYKKLK